MSISIIIPAFNAERYLSATLDSVRNQTAGDWEAIVVNDGSTDGTAHVAERYAQSDPRIRVWHQENRGLSASRNSGLAQADPARPLTLFLDADDLLEPCALESLGSELETYPGAPAVHGMGRYISGDGIDRPELGVFPNSRLGVKLNGVTFSLAERDDTGRHTLVIRNCILSAGAVLIRKNALAQAGPWDPKFGSVEDLDMWYRLAGVNPIRFLPKVVLAYRVHGGSMSRKREKMRQASIMVREEWLATGNKADRQLVRAGYRVIVRQGARLRLSNVLKSFKERKWSNAVRAAIPAMAGLVKIIPGAADLFLKFQSRRLASRSK